MLWNFGDILVSCWINSKYFHSYAAFGLMNPFCSKRGDKLSHNSIYIIFWRNMCKMSIWGNHSKFAILVFKAVVGHTDQALKYVDCINQLHQHVFWWYQWSLIQQSLKKKLTRGMNKPFVNNEHIVGKLQAIWSMFTTCFSDSIMVMYGYVYNKIFWITLMIVIEDL